MAEIPACANCRGMTRIAIVGPGAVGGVVAAWLNASGRHEVVLCARRPLGPMTVEVPGRTFRFTPTVFTDPKQARQFDWILVATKAYDAGGAAAWFPALSGNARPPIAILQNGVEHVDRFAPFVPVERLLPVMIDIPCERTSPVDLRQRLPGRLVAPEGQLGTQFAQLFADTELQAATHPDFRSVVWRKLCQNSAGILAAILLQPARIMHDEKIAELGRGIVRECVAVGRAEGAVLGDTVPDEVVQNYRSQPPDSLNSIHADRAAGRPMEIDARNGVIVRLGRKHGIPTPYNTMAATLLEAMTG